MCLQNFTIIIRTIDQSTILYQPTKELWAYGTHKENNNDCLWTSTIEWLHAMVTGCKTTTTPSVPLCFIQKTAWQVAVS